MVFRFLVFDKAWLVGLKRGKYTPYSILGVFFSLGAGFDKE